MIERPKQTLSEQRLDGGRLAAAPAESDPAPGPSSSVDESILDQIDEMQDCVVRREVGDLGMWRELCKKHSALLREEGFANFKRTINFEYHQWAVTTYRDPKSMTLLKKLLLRGRIPWSLANTGVGAGTTEGIERSRGPATPRQMRAYRFYVSLLWDYARLEDQLGCLEKLDEPPIGNPLEIRAGRKLLSQDLALSTLEINSIARICDLSRIRRVAEIGAGYGRLAWTALSIEPRLSYTIIDIPPALAISQNYLVRCFGPGRVSLFRDSNPIGEPAFFQAGPGTVSCLLPYQTENVPDRYFDLAVNISSFDEMPRTQVERYFALIDRTLSGWLYLKGYKSNRRTGWRYESFPYKSHWRRVWQRTDPSNDLFVEQIFSVNADG